MSLWVFPKESELGEVIYHALRVESAEACKTSQSGGVCCQASGPHNDVSIIVPEASDTVFVFMPWQPFRYYPMLSMASLEMWTRTLAPEEEDVSNKGQFCLCL